MHKQNRLIQVFFPSLASGITAAGLGVITFIGAAFFYFAHDGSIYNFLFGQASSEEAVRHSKDTIGTLFNNVFGNDLLNKLLYFAFWMVVGLLVYFLLYTLIKGVSGAAEDIEATTYKNARLEEVLSGLISRQAVRLLAIVLWVMYIIFFIKVILTYCTLLTHLAMSNLPNISGWVYSILAIGILTLSFHIHLIFLRFIALKVRLIDSGVTE